MSEIASGFVSLVPSARGFGAATQRQIGPGLNSAAKTSGSRFGKVFAMSSMSPLKAIGAAAVGLFAIREVKDFFGAAVSEARESQKVSAITAQVIKSTGGAAQISAKQVGQLATAISLKTGVDDEAIQSASNLLLTFKNLRNEAGKGNDVFSQTTQIAVDMGAALGNEPKAAAIQLGKALNDPVKGITALTRVGVSFTEGQKAQISAMVESGNTIGAQKIILKELNSEFGGAAAASATAGDKFKTAFANLQEAVGTALLPYIDRALTALTGFVSFLMTRVPPAFAAIKAAVAPVASAIGDFISAHMQPFLTLLSGVGGAAVAAFAALLGGTLVSALGILLGALASPVAIIGALAGAAVYAYTHFEGFRTTIKNLVAALKANLGPALQAAGAFFTTTLLPGIMAIVSAVQANFLPVLQQAATTFTTVILPAISGLVTYLVGTLAPVFTQIVAVITGQVIPILSSLAQFVYGQLYPAIVQIVVAVGQKLQPVFDAWVSALKTQVIPAIQSLLTKFRENQPAIQTAVLAVAKITGKVLEFAAAVLAKVLPVVIKFQAFMAGQFISGIGTAIGALVKIVQAVIKVGQQFVEGANQIDKFVRAVGSGIAKAVKAVASLPGKVQSALAGMYAAGLHAAEELIRGLVAGLMAGIGKVKDAVSSVASAIKDHFPGSPVKTGPLLSWNNGGAGKRLVGMLADGLNAAAPDAGRAATNVADAVRKPLEAMRDKLKSQLEGLKSDFASLSSSVASAFTGDAFSATNQLAFFDNLISTQGTLKHLRRAFKKLLKWGLDPKFLSQLFQSGNSALIFDLADGTKTQALVDSQIFTANQGLANQLGGQVAQADLGPKIDATNKALHHIRQEIAALPKHIGHEINGSVRHGQRKAS